MDYERNVHYSCEIRILYLSFSTGQTLKPSIFMLDLSILSNIPIIISVSAYALAVLTITIFIAKFCPLSVFSIFLMSLCYVNSHGACCYGDLVKVSACVPFYVPREYIGVITRS